MPDCWHQLLNHLNFLRKHFKSLTKILWKGSPRNGQFCVNVGGSFFTLSLTTWLSGCFACFQGSCFLESCQVISNHRNCITSNFICNAESPRKSMEIRVKESIATIHIIVGWLLDNTKCAHLGQTCSACSDHVAYSNDCVRMLGSLSIFPYPLV